MKSFMMEKGITLRGNRPLSLRLSIVMEILAVRWEKLTMQPKSMEEEIVKEFYTKVAINQDDDMVEV